MTFVNYPGHIVATVLVVAVIAVLFWTHRGGELRRRYTATALFFLLNLVAATVLLVLIWDPSAPTGGADTVPNEVLVYVDTSESMSTVDEGAETARLDRVAARLDRLFPEDSANGPAVRLLGFDQSPYPCRAMDALSRWGQASNLLSALSSAERAAVETLPGSEVTPVAGVVLFTDGQADGKALAGYPAFSRAGLPVAIVGVGSDRASRDIAITALNGPLQTTVDSSYTIRVTATGEVSDDIEAIPLEILRNGQPARQVSVTRSMLKTGTPLDVELYADTLGTDRIEARLGTLPGETNTVNNRREATVAVREEPRLRTLLYTQWLSPDIGRVRSALARIKKVQLDTRIDARIIDESPYRSPKLAQPDRPQFPDSAESLRDFDLVIIGPCDPATFSREQAEALYAFVSERGGGLLLLPGAPGHDLGSTPNDSLRSLLPAEVALDTRPDNRAAARLQPTTAGERLNVIPAGIFAETQASLTPAYVALPKPATTTLAASGDDPALCLQRVGRGHTALLNLRGIFQLYRANENGGPLRELLSGLVTYLGAAPQAESRLDLFAERDPDHPDRVDFRANVLAEDFTPIADANVLLTVDGTTYGMAPEGGGGYRTTVTAGGRSTVLATVEAARDGVYIGERTVALALPATRHEMDDTSADHAFLEQLASHVGAAYYTLETFPEDWAGDLPASTTIETAGEPASAWRTWTILGFLCGLLSINWFARRMLGLI